MNDIAFMEEIRRRIHYNGWENTLELIGETLHNYAATRLEIATARIVEDLCVVGEVMDKT